MSDPNSVTENSVNEILLMLPGLCSTENVDDGMGFYGSQNLFKRIIRNPASYGRPPKERECTEMLCGCLIHMPVFRVGFLKTLAGKVEQDVDFDTLELKFNTEQSVLGKRDDLRIEGYGSDRGTHQLIWTIELKVGTGFHYSTSVTHAKEENDEGFKDGVSGNDVGLVHQVKNYDLWLSSKKEVLYRAGFVISVWDQKENMPPNKDLKNPWICLTWYDLAEDLRNFLVKKNLPEIERFLGGHLLGFIEQALRGHKMAMNLELEDLAFYKAFSQHGPILNKKISNIIDSVFERLKIDKPLPHDPKLQNLLYGGLNRYIYIWGITGNSNNSPPYLMAGITPERGESLAVWIENTPKYEKKEAIRAFLADKIKDLQHRNPRWQIVRLEISNWWEIELRVPLEIILGQEDQVEWMYQHFQKVFKDLEEVGIIKGIQDIVLGETAEQESPHT